MMDKIFAVYDTRNILLSNIKIHILSIEFKQRITIIPQK